MNRRTYLATASAAVLGALAGCSVDENGGGMPPNPEYDAGPVKENAERVAYAELFRNADAYDGEPLHFPDATVVQVVRPGGTDVDLRFAVNDAGDDVYGDLYGGRFFENDIVECWGIGAGLHTYETELGYERTIPGVDLVDVELLEAA